MKLNKEIRIKSEPDISDDMLLHLVSSAVSQGKISNGGKSYCYATLFEVNAQKYMVEANDKGKSQMFYVYKKGENDGNG